MRRWIAGLSIVVALTGGSACHLNLGGGASASSSSRGSSSGSFGLPSLGGVMFAVGGVLVYAAATGELHGDDEERSISTDIAYGTLGAALAVTGIWLLFRD